MTLDASQYGNPEYVLERKQQAAINRQANMERVCAGCVHKRILIVGEAKVKACALKRGNPTIWCNFKQVEKE